MAMYYHDTKYRRRAFHVNCPWIAVVRSYEETTMNRKTTIIALLAVLVWTCTASADLVGWWRFNEGSGSVAVDASGGRMYWTDYGTQMIQAADLDGNNVTNLVTSGLSTPAGIAVAGGKT